VVLSPTNNNKPKGNIVESRNYTDQYRHVQETSTNGNITEIVAWTAVDGESRRFYECRIHRRSTGSRCWYLSIKTEKLPGEWFVLTMFVASDSETARDVLYTQHHILAC
jgi:hypothetical protein